jgi:hypothetical protein
MIPTKTFVAAILVASVFLYSGAPDSFAQTAPGSPPAPPVIPEASTLPGDVSPPPPIPRAQRTLDLVVTVTMGTGKSETFAREVDRLEIITFPDGRIDMVHLVLIAAGERNTHVWYNFSQVAKLSYRFVTPEGRDRVHVRVIQPSESKRSLIEPLEPLSPREFR